MARFAGAAADSVPAGARTTGARRNAQSLRMRKLTAEVRAVTISDAGRVGSYSTP